MDLVDNIPVDYLNQGINDILFPPDHMWYSNMRGFQKNSIGHYERIFRTDRPFQNGQLSNLKIQRIFLLGPQILFLSLLLTKQIRFLTLKNGSFMSLSQTSSFTRHVTEVVFDGINVEVWDTVIALYPNILIVPAVNASQIFFSIYNKRDCFANSLWNLLKDLTF